MDILKVEQVLLAQRDISSKQDRPRGRIISAGPSAIKSVFQNKAACKSKYKNLETPKIIW